MGATPQDFLTIVGGAIIVALLTATAVWLFSKAATASIAPVGLLLVGFCIEIFFFNKQPYVQAGLQIYHNDAISIIVLLAAIVSFAHRPLPLYETPFLLWLGFGITIIASFVVGLNEYGRYAGTEVRPYFYMWVAGLYCAISNFSEDDLSRIARWCLWTAYVVIGIALYYWIAVEVGFVNRQEFYDETDTATFRPVAAHAALFVAAVGLVQTMVWLRGSGTRLAGLHAAVFFAFIIIMQHRSVWIAAAVGLLSVLMLERRLLPRRFGLLLGFALSITLAIAVAATFGVFDDLAQRLLVSTVSMTDSGGTFAARADSWDRLLESWLEAQSYTLLFGFPFGKGYVRMFNGMVIDFAPHNFYLDLILRVGIVGAILFVVASGMVIVHGLRVKCATEFEYVLARGLGVVLLAAMVFCVVYPSNYTLCAATGVAMAQMIRQRRTHDWQQQTPPAETFGTLIGRPMNWPVDR